MWRRSGCGTRLVNVALTWWMRIGTPVGGFEKKDFQIFEDGKPQSIAVFERDGDEPVVDCAGDRFE